jgi:hypothetical protein
MNSTHSGCRKSLAAFAVLQKQQSRGAERRNPPNKTAPLLKKYAAGAPNSLPGGTSRCQLSGSQCRFADQGSKARAMRRKVPSKEARAGTLGEQAAGGPSSGLLRRFA